MLVATVSRFDGCSFPQGVVHAALNDVMEDPSLEVLRHVYDCISAVDCGPVLATLGDLPRDARQKAWALSRRRRMLRSSLPLRGCSYGSVLFGPESKPASAVVHAFWSESRRLDVSIPLDQDAAQMNARMAKFLRLFGAGVAVIYNAVLTGKRVIFVGHKSLPAGTFVDSIDTVRTYVESADTPLSFGV